MKKLTAYAAAVVLAASCNVALPTAASAAANDEVQVCRLLVELQFFDSHGACMSQLRTNAPRTCRQLRDYDALDFFNFRNVGDCVSAFRAAT
ncbi:hypothetical protein [Aurantiacibacter gilvus]|uniref:Uncharacterized protein n=1 Tax=Aurantiacibacter gilvus TaxID=3139141 RepID=A0ABU9IFW1_9SPHN